MQKPVRKQGQYQEDCATPIPHPPEYNRLVHIALASARAFAPCRKLHFRGAANFEFCYF